MWEKVQIHPKLCNNFNSAAIDFFKHIYITWWVTNYFSTSKNFQHFAHLVAVDIIIYILNIHVNTIPVWQILVHLWTRQLRILLHTCSHSTVVVCPHLTRFLMLVLRELTTGEKLKPSFFYVAIILCYRHQINSSKQQKHLSSVNLVINVSIPF